MQEGTNIMGKIWKWSLLSLGLIAVIIVGYYTYSILKFGQDLQKKPEDSRFKSFYEDDVAPVYEPPKWEGKERVNILLLGGDSRGLSEHEAPRSDTMLVASVDPVTKTASLFSILRDTYVDIPGFGKDRINAALAYGGPDLSMKTVSELTGLPIQYYVYVDFQGFIKLVDAIGGVKYYVEKDMKYTDPTDDPMFNIDLQEGCQVLDGNKALQYVRFRHDALSDFTRTERQRNFLKAVAAKLQSTTSLIKLPSILKQIEPYIETNMNLDTMLRLGTLAFSVSSSTVEDYQLPPNELLRDMRVNGAAVLGVDPERLREYVREMLERAASETADGASGAGSAGTSGGGGNGATSAGADGAAGAAGSASGGGTSAGSVANTGGGAGSGSGKSADSAGSGASRDDSATGASGGASQEKPLPICE